MCIGINRPHPIVLSIVAMYLQVTRITPIGDWYFLIFFNEHDPIWGGAYWRDRSIIEYSNEELALWENRRCARRVQALSVSGRVMSICNDRKSAPRTHK